MTTPPMCPPWCNRNHTDVWDMDGGDPHRHCIGTITAAATIDGQPVTLVLERFIEPNNLDMDPTVTIGGLRMDRIETGRLLSALSDLLVCTARPQRVA